MLVVVACQPVREAEEKKEEASVKAVVVDAPVVGDTLERPVEGCDAELSDAPVALFGDTMLSRLPVGVEVTEVSPTLAKMLAPQAVSTCGAVVRMAALGRIEAAPARSVTEIRDAIVGGELGFRPGTLTWSEEFPQDRHYHGAYTRVGEGGGRFKGWFALLQKMGVGVWVAYETDEGSWPALAATFQQAGKRVLIVPLAPGSEAKGGG